MRQITKQSGSPRKQQQQQCVTDFMTILSYSGRGRGGRSLHQNSGRGRGRSYVRRRPTPRRPPASSMHWVRPPARTTTRVKQDSVVSATTVGVQEEGTATQISAHHRETSSSVVPHASSSVVPDGIPGKRRTSPRLSGHKEDRSSVKVPTASQTAAELTSSQQGPNSAKGVGGGSPQKKTELSNPPPASKHNVDQKSKNRSEKAILKYSNTRTKPAPRKRTYYYPTRQQTTTCMNHQNVRTETSTIAASSHESESSTAELSTRSAPTTVQQQQQQQQVSRNKQWIRPTQDEPTTTGTATTTAPITKARLKYSKVVLVAQPAATRKKQFRPGHVVAAPKRIKVTHEALPVDHNKKAVSDDDDDGPRVSSEEHQSSSNAINSGAAGAGAQQGKSIFVEKKLTDFAYRETGKRRATTRSKGLVRVQPNVAKTPICPTFLRGVACDDEKCWKRHDVPPEFAMPICSFFQRQGMCLNDQCRFRHVKVNRRATPCPSFELLGFCEDLNCAMMHSHPSKSSKHTKTSRPIKKGASSSG